MGEVFFIISLIAFLILPFAIMLKGGKRGAIFWMATMSIIGLVVVSAEITGKITSDLTISRMFWNWSLENEALVYNFQGFSLN